MQYLFIFLSVLVVAAIVVVASFGVIYSRLALVGHPLLPSHSTLVGYFLLSAGTMLGVHTPEGVLGASSIVMFLVVAEALSGIFLLVVAILAFSTGADKQAARLLATAEAASRVLLTEIEDTYFVPAGVMTKPKAAGIASMTVQVDLGGAAIADGSEGPSGSKAESGLGQ
jgi:hypothetical protein